MATNTTKTEETTAPATLSGSDLVALFKGSKIQGATRDEKTKKLKPSERSPRADDFLSHRVDGKTVIAVMIDGQKLTAAL